MGQLESMADDPDNFFPSPQRTTLFVVRNGRYEPQNLMPVLPRSDILDFDGFVMRRGANGRGMSVRPPEMRQGSLVKNPMNIRRDSARIVSQPSSPTSGITSNLERSISNADSILSFTFDAQRGGNLSVHLLVKEFERPLGNPPVVKEEPVQEASPTKKKKDAPKELVPREIELHPQDRPESQEVTVGMELHTIRFEAGLGQAYKSPPFDLSRWSDEQLSFDPTRPKDIPIAVRMEADYVQSESPPQPIHYTYISLLRGRNPTQEIDKDEDVADTGNMNSTSQLRTAQIFMQKLQCGGECYVLHEVFGVTSKSTHLEAEVGNQDCVICLSEPRDTAVLPCRHMCFCSYCAGIVRLQCDRCPICRQKVSSLLQFKRGQDQAIEDIRCDGPNVGKHAGAQGPLNGSGVPTNTMPTTDSGEASSAAAPPHRRPSQQSAASSSAGFGNGY